MRKPLFILFILLSTSTMVWALDVSIKTKIEGGDRPIFIGKTNLPDGMELMLTIRRESSAYSGQDKVIVSGGEFRSATFSQGGAPLNTGTYKLEISSSLAGFQSPSVQSVIGSNGNNLKGPLTKKSKFGGGKVVDYKTTFRIGGGSASSDKDKSAREKSKKDKHDWWIQSCKDQCNLLNNSAIKRGTAFDWGSCYEKCLTDEPK